MKISFVKPGLPDAGAIIVGVFENGRLSPSAKKIDGESGGVIARAIAASRFSGKAEQTLSIPAPAGLTAGRLVLLGLGAPDKFDAKAARGFGGAAIAAIEASGLAEAALFVDAFDDVSLAPEQSAAEAALGAALRSYRFDKYFTRKKDDEKPSLKKLSIASPQAAAAKKLYQDLEPLADGVKTARDLVSEPANALYPETLAAEAAKLADLGVEVEILGEKQMKKLGMGALLGVGQGSERESRLAVLRWKGAEADRPIAFVGKGVTFDTGGISIKPAAGMEEMKWDMGGAAVVIGLMKALAGRKAKIDAVGVIGLVENMPSGSAQRPGDVVKSASGQTIEVINTDAEGRLVLADALWYVQDRFKPHSIIDLATLTGAIIISLGDRYAGMFANDDTLADRLSAAGRVAGEELWRMPVDDYYDKMLKSDIADMKNVGGREGGSSSAAMFIKRFIEKDVKWAHLDIAGVAWSKKATPVAPKGATAFGVRLLEKLVADYYEEK